MMGKQNERTSTETKNTDTIELLQNQLQQHQAIIESVSDAIITTDLEFTIQSWNKAAEKMYGWKKNEAIGKRMNEVIPTDYLDNAREDVIAEFQKNGTWQGDVIQTTKDNQDLFIHASVNLVYDADNRPLQVVAINRDITEFKKYELALRDSENRSKALINAVNDTLILVEPDGKIVLANKALAERFNHTVDEIIGMNVFELFPGEPAERRKRFAQITLSESGQTTFVDSRAGRDFETQAYPLKNDDGEITHLAVFSHDITEHNKTKRALQQSEELFRNVLETVQLIGLMLDDKGNITFCNDYLLNLTGWSRKEVLGKSWFEYFLPDSVRDAVADIFTETIINGSFPTYYENEIITKEGELRLVGWNNTSYRDGNGRVTGITSIGQDITEQRQRDNELRRLNRAIEQSPVSVVITDLDGRIEYVNPKFSEVTGYTFEESIGQNPSILNSGEQDKQFYKAMWEKIISGEAWHGEFLNKRKNGEIFWEAASISPILNQEGQITSFVAVKEEITEQKKLQARLRQQERLAAVGQLAAGIAHDFNNIMTVILLYSELLEKSPVLPSTLASKVQTIIKQSKRASELIEQILDFSHQSVLKREALDLLPLVSEMVSLLNRTLPDNIELSLTHNESSFIVHADRTRIQQVLMNLCVNARDAMPNGGQLDITITMRNVSDIENAIHLNLTEGDWIELIVKDSGVGIAEEVLPRIFEPFFTTKPSGRGNGLGLAQVHGIIKQHDGEIDVQSKVDEGASFTIYLPRFYSNTISPKVDHPIEIPKGHGETILIVEDDPFTRQSLVETLKHLEYVTIEAENGRIALEILNEQNHSIQLILSDVVMPEIGGIAMLKILNAKNNKIPVILITGHLLSNELDIAEMEGLNGFISKPPKLDELAEVIYSTLNSISK